MNEAVYAIRAVAARSGLSQHTIRIWERRYSAIEPSRTGTNRRLYTEADVRRLTLLRELTEAGHAISTVATLPTDQLRKLVQTVPDHPARRPGGRESADKEVAGFMENALTAIADLNSQKLEEILAEAAVELGSQGVLYRLVAPLAERIGDRWREGTLTAGHEHFASAVIRLFLGHLARSYSPGSETTTIVIATPSGQLHELGALLAAAAAANIGWRVIYLGSSLPALEIAGAARQHRARAIGLSIVYPDDDARLAQELAQLRQALGPETEIIIGGRAAVSYAKTLQAIRATLVADIPMFSSSLEAIRKGDNAARSLPEAANVDPKSGERAPSTGKQTQRPCRIRPASAPK